LATGLRQEVQDVVMAEAIQNETQEFWRPPLAPAQPNMPSMAGTCGDCGSEFMVGASFCHTCGAERNTSATSVKTDWTPSLDYLRFLEFQNIKLWLRLSTASFVAFMMGAGCLLAAVLVGFVYSAQSLADFQAIQLWRIEWLLAAVAAFLAGLLLKRDEPIEK
jgi:hypothetical protein